jgi:rhodanese-related sulfurtransferase
LEYYLVGYVLASILVLFIFYQKFKKITKRAVPIDIQSIDEEQFEKIKWVDVRTFRETESMSIEGTHCICWDHILNNDFDKDDKIVTFCNSVIRSSKAAEILLQSGFWNTSFYDGHLSEVGLLLAKVKNKVDGILKS